MGTDFGKPALNLSKGSGTIFDCKKHIMEESHSGPVHRFAKPASCKAHVGSNPTSSATLRSLSFGWLTAIRTRSKKGATRSFTTLRRRLWVVTSNFREGWCEGLQQMYYVYLLKLKDSSIYTGSTPDLGRRLKQHRDGLVKSTKNLSPVSFVWSAGFKYRSTALRFEQYLKTGSGQAFRNKRLI